MSEEAVAGNRPGGPGFAPRDWEAGVVDSAPGLEPTRLTTPHTEAR